MTFCTVAMYVSKDIHVHMYMFRVCTNVYVLAHELHSFCTYIHTPTEVHVTTNTLQVCSTTRYVSCCKSSPRSKTEMGCVLEQFHLLN